MPEVSLVAILDADKEGFLRSDRSLIQTIGRAARNVNGRAILYGDTITGSMERAIKETERRRDKQQQYNLAHQITPQALHKPVTDVMDLGDNSSPSSERRVAENSPEYDTKSSVELLATIATLEKQMFEHAKNLEFEEAAGLRDQVELLRKRLLDVT